MTPGVLYAVYASTPRAHVPRRSAAAPWRSAGWRRCCGNDAVLAGPWRRGSRQQRHRYRASTARARHSPRNTTRPANAWPAPALLQPRPLAAAPRTASSCALLLLGGRPQAARCWRCARSAGIVAAVRRARRACAPPFSKQQKGARFGVASAALADCGSTCAALHLAV